MSDKSRAVDEAAARTLILGVVHRDAFLAREDGDTSHAGQIFETEAKVEFPGGRMISATELGEITRSNPPKLLRHHLTTVDVHLVSSTEAQCGAFVIAGTDLRMPDHWGRWDYVLRMQTDGGWLIHKKTVTVDGLDPNGWLAQSFPQDDGQQ